MFKLMGKKTINILRKWNFHIWTYGHIMAMLYPNPCYNKVWYKSCNIFWFFFQSYDTDQLDFVVFILYYAATLVQLVLSCFAEVLPQPSGKVR